MEYSGRIIDIHTHIWPDDVISGRNSYFESEPDFRLLYENPKSVMSDGAGITGHMNENGVDISVILGFAWRNRALLKNHNDIILREASLSGGRFLGFTCVYPFSGAAADEAERCLKAGAAGIGEVGVYARDFDSEYIAAMAPVMEVCRASGKPVMMHVNEPVGHDYSGKAPMTLKGIYEFIKAYPGNRIILAHWGGGLFFFNSLKKEAGKVLENVWYDSAATPYLYDKKIWKTAVDIIGSEKILFGTDFPLLDARRYISELEESGLDAEALERICCKNAEELLGIEI